MDGTTKVLWACVSFAMTRTRANLHIPRRRDIFCNHIPAGRSGRPRELISAGGIISGNNIRDTNFPASHRVEVVTRAVNRSELRSAQFQNYGQFLLTGSMIEAESNKMSQALEYCRRYHLPISNTERS